MAYLGVSSIPNVINNEVSGVNVGTVVEFPLGKIAGGYLKTDGSQYSRQTFPDLFRYLGTETLPLREHEYRVGDVKWFPKRTKIDPDFLPADGELYQRADYNIAGIIANDTVHWATESRWTSDPSVRLHWSWGDDVTTFRTPDMNGKSGGTLGSVFVRGDGKNSAGSGHIQSGEIQGHGHELNQSSTIWHDQMPSAGATMFITPATTGTRWCTTIPQVLTSVASTGGAETRPLNTSGCWAVRVKYSTEFAIKAAGFVENDGVVDVSGLVQENIELRKQISDYINRPILNAISNTNHSYIGVNGITNPSYQLATVHGFAFNKDTASGVVPKSGLYKFSASYTCQAAEGGVISNTTGRIVRSEGRKYTIICNYQLTTSNAQVIATTSGEIHLYLEAGETFAFEVGAENNTKFRMWTPGHLTVEFIRGLQ